MGKVSGLMKPPFLFMVYSQLSLSELSDITGECKALIVHVAFKQRYTYIKAFNEKIDDDDIRESRIKLIKEMIPIDKLMCDFCELTDRDYLESFTPEHIEEVYHLGIEKSLMFQYFENLEE